MQVAWETAPRHPTTLWQDPRQAWECGWRERSLSPGNQQLGAGQEEAKFIYSNLMWNHWGQTQTVQTGPAPAQAGSCSNSSSDPSFHL